jgi:hypothetical protein
MTQAEGVIKYQLDFEPADLGVIRGLADLLRWRDRLHQTGLLGQNPIRYDGYGYGNVSLRTGAASFLISGTQTGELARLQARHFAEVTGVDQSANRVTARGRVKPSSEALTHAAIYHLNQSINCVLHVHSPLIWQRAQHRGLPCTPADAEYGTTQMAAAVRALYAENPNTDTGVFAMLGHSDGVIAFGQRPDSAGAALLACLQSVRSKAAITVN